MHMKEAFLRQPADLRLRQLETLADANEILDDLYTPRELMRFKIVYDGPLPSGNRPRPKEKWEIRRQVDAQLADLWNTNPILTGLGLSTSAYLGGFYAQAGAPLPISKLRIDVAQDDDVRAALIAPSIIGGRRFIPLVRHSFALQCKLDVLFLRAEDPGSLITNNGDLDNRIKVLFDGLRSPQTITELDDESIEEARPFYTLLENDDLITGFSVQTDRLLSRRDKPTDHVMLVIEVLVVPERVTGQNMAFLAD